MSEADPSRPARPFARGADPQGVGDPELDAALDALSTPGRLREAEQRVAALAPKLQRILGTALQEGGWFDEAHRAEVLKAATKPDPDDRIAAVRTLLAEETRIAMMIGVTVGWELAGELGGDQQGAGREGPAAGRDEQGAGREEPDAPSPDTPAGPGDATAGSPEERGPRGTAPEDAHD